MARGSGKTLCLPVDIHFRRAAREARERSELKLEFSPADFTREVDGWADPMILLRSGPRIADILDTPKPFEPDELLARVKSILRRIQPSMNGLTFVSLGDIELDERQRRLTRGGVAIELTGAEFSLLRLLISRPGSTFSRQELIPRVLSRQESGIDRSIDSLVSNLRRKLGPFPDGS